MQKNIEKILKENVQKLIESKIIKNEKDLEDPTLDTIGKIAQELHICPNDLLAYLLCGNNCSNCEKCSIEPLV